MELSSADEIHTDAEMVVPTGRIQILRRVWKSAIDIVAFSGSFRLELALLARPPNASWACFPEHWGPHRYEPIGGLFLLPSQQHFQARSECQHQNSIVITFSEQAAAAWLGADLEWTDRRLRASLDITSQEIRALLFRIGEEMRTPGLAARALIELMAAQVAIELSRYFLAIEEEKAAGGLSPWRLRLIDERLLANAGALSVLDLANMFSISTRHLTRAFRVSRGRSIASYVLEHRMNHAKQMLASGGSVNAVAGAMGFTTASNFTIAFRRATGETPREYKQRVHHSMKMITAPMH